MSLDVRLHRRRSTRLRARDYSSPGHYFVTLCTRDRRLLFGDVVDGIMRLNNVGHAVESFWNEIPRHFPHAELDESVVMPNHLHGIIRIVDHRWVRMDAPVRAIGIPIVPDMWVAGSDVPYHVGANDYLPLHPPHLPLQQRISPQRPLTRSKLFPMGHGTSRTIGSMVRGFKIAVTRWARTHGDIGTHANGVWQRIYHDHVIRNQRSLERICAYIRNNPANWGRDRNNPERRV